ncbi:MAG: hypothetical protein P4M11_04440 [Candidatus Pacebacteria bacterium]|nr:hypothetical protein [Candidatus Paceibacterota bacterium]
MQVRYASPEKGAGMGFPLREGSSRATLGVIALRSAGTKDRVKLRLWARGLRAKGRASESFQPVRRLSMCADSFEFRLRISSSEAQSSEQRLRTGEK